MPQLLERHDAAAVFGMRYDGQDPQNFFNSLDAAAAALQAETVGRILVCGKGWIGNKKLSGPPESRVGKDYLVDQKGISSGAVLEASESTSAVGNLLELKKGFAMQEGWFSWLVPIAEYTIPRRRFIADKIMGPDYRVDFIGVACPPQEVYPDEEKSFRIHRKLLQNMPAGDHEWLDRQGGWDNMMMEYLHIHEPWLFEN